MVFILYLLVHHDHGNKQNESKATAHQQGSSKAGFSLKPPSHTSQQPPAQQLKQKSKPALQMKNGEYLDSASQALSTNQSALQRKVTVEGTTWTKHNLHARSTGGKFAELYKKLTHSQRNQLDDWAKDDVEGVERTYATWAELAAHLEKVTAVPATGATTTTSGTGSVGSGATSSETKENEWQKVDGGMEVRVLSASGGYNIIWEIKDMPEFVIRDPQEGAVDIATGLANWQALSQKLKRYKGRARVPEIYNPGDAVEEETYVVERVTGTIDAHSLWEKVNSSAASTSERDAARTQLRVIAEMFQDNIRQYQAGRAEAFPDFRPSNIGFKAGSLELIYIDFDQSPEVQSAETLKAHAMEWAGRRFLRDAGGERKPDPGLWNFITGNMLGDMKDSIDIL